MPDLISFSLADAALAEPATLPARKSAGLAWALSVVIPGAGHLYSGLYLRAGLVFGFSVLGLLAFAASVSGPRDVGSVADALLFALPVLWVFGFLDAYLTTVERNRGIDPGMVDNPRVAAVLNLTTKGFGYFYLGERAKGVTLFVVLSIVPLVASALSDAARAVVGTLVMAVTVWITIDAYRLGHKAFLSQVASMELPPSPPSSRLPLAAPLILAGLTGLLLFLLLAVGTIMQLRGAVPQ